MPERYRRPRIEDIRENVERMRQAWATESEARLIVQHFNAKLSTKASAGFWPTIAKAITAKHPWLVIVCDSCGTVVDLDLRVKPRDPDASIRVALRDVRVRSVCPIGLIVSRRVTQIPYPTTNIYIVVIAPNKEQTYSGSQNDNHGGLC